MKRGEVWTQAGGGDFAGKPRPVVILQDDRFTDIASITVCPLTSNPSEAPLFRLAIQPTAGNGLDAPSRIMVDKITTVRRTRLRERIGQLEDDEMRALGQALLVFLGIADTVTGELEGSERDA